MNVFLATLRGLARGALVGLLILAITLALVWGATLALTARADVVSTPCVDLTAYHWIVPTPDLLVCRPTGTGQYECIPFPQGAVILVPRAPADTTEAK